MKAIGSSSTKMQGAQDDAEFKETGSTWMTKVICYSFHTVTDGEDEFNFLCIKR